MAGEIQIGGTTFATESAGTVTVSNVDSATNRTNLGLGSMATQNANAVALTGGSLTGTEIDLKSSGTTIYKSDGTTAVLSESSGVVTLNNGTIGSGVVFPAGHVIKTEMSGNISATTTSNTDVTVISPTFTTTVENSKIYIMMTLLARVQGAGNGFIYVKLYHGATILLDGYPIVGSTDGNDNRGVAAWNYLYSPNVSANTTLTFDLKINAFYASTVYINSGATPSHITFMEIAP